MRSFASDNYSGMHPRVLEALQAANHDHERAYGDDEYTRRAEQVFARHFGAEAEVFFVLTGTAANVLSLNSALRTFEGAICSSISHLHVDECGAPERLCGSKLIIVPDRNGKIAVADIAAMLGGRGDQHRVQPRLVSITQSTEYGTVYKPEEIREISAFAKKHELYLHMDGARLSNAAASLGCSLSEITSGCGVDVLSFGGTKNGMMLGEAVVFFDRNLARNFKFLRKQAMQLASKMRFVAAQFLAMLEADLWLGNARHANQMADKLAAGLRGIPAIQISRPVEANAVFMRLPKEAIAQLQQHYFFYVWDEGTNEVRLMTSFDTRAADVETFLALAEKILA